MVNTLRVRWHSDRLCHSCFYTAMRTHGIGNRARAARHYQRIRSRKR